MSYFNRVLLGLSEVVVNSIVHGNCLNQDKKVIINVYLNDDVLFFDVKDEGSGFLVDDLPDPTTVNNLKKESGRGIFILNKTADEVRFEDGGSRVLIKYTFVK